MSGTRMPGGQSRWSAGKDLSWEPLRIERVCEVKYDHMQGDRFRHAAVFQRWRPDRQPQRLPLRSARGHDSLRAREGLRRGVAPFFGHAAAGQSFTSSSGSSVSCAGRSASGTCCRLTRMRVHVRNRPRIASTSTSAGSRCPAAQGGAPSSARARPAHRPFRARARSRAADAWARDAVRGCGSSAPPFRRRDARRLARLLAVVRRPRRVAEPLLLLARRQLEQRLERARDARRCRHGDRRRPQTRAGIVASVKSAGSHASTSSHASGADTRASGFGRTEYAAATVRSFAFWL